MTFWFPVAPGITTLPAAPAVVGGQMTVTTVVPVFNETIKLEAIARPRIVVYSADYALQLTTVAPDLVYRTEFAYLVLRGLLGASAGSYILNQSIETALKYTKTTSAAAGLFTLQGQSASWFQNRVLAGSPGAFLASDGNTLVVRRYTFTPEVGIFALQGEGAALRTPIKLAAEPGVFSLGGESASLLLPSRVITADVGGFAANGQNADLAYAANIGDDYFSSVRLLMHFNDANGSTTFVDSSNNVLSLTSVNGASTTTALSKFGTACLNLSTSANRYLSYPSASGDALDVLANQNVTVEFWAYFTAVETGTTLGSFNTIFELSGGTSFSIHANTGVGGNPSLAWSVGYSNTNRFYHQSNFTLNTWHHIAMVRDGNIWNLYLNGVKSTSSFTNSNSAPNTNFVIIGPRQTTSRLYVDEFRMTVGFARYFTNFTPDSQPFPDQVLAGMDPYWPNTGLLLHGSGSVGSTRFIDSSSIEMISSYAGNATISNLQSVFGGASIYLDGTGDMVIFRDNDAWNFADSNFTIELFIYLANNSNEMVLMSQASSATLRASFELSWSPTSSGIMSFKYSTTGSSFVSAFDIACPLNTGQWYHVAVTRSSSSIRLFLNGTQLGSTSTTIGTGSIFNSTEPLRIGGRSTSVSLPFNGYMDELRLTKGFARYVSNFAVPTAPFFDQSTVPLGRVIDARVNSTQSSLTASGSCPMPTSQAGDLLIAIIGTSSAITSVPAGWTLYGTYVTAMYATRRMNVFTKTAVSSEPGSFSWSMASANYSSGTVATIRNAQIATVTQAYGTGVLGNGKIKTIPNKLNLICTYWVFSFGDVNDFYFTTISNGFIGEISESPKSYARMGGAYTRSGGDASITINANSNNNDSIGMINIQFDN